MSFVPVSGHAKGPLRGRALVTYRTLDLVLGRLHLGRHGTSHRGFVRASDPARAGSQRQLPLTGPRPTSAWVSVLVELGVVEDLLDQGRNVSDPSLQAERDCGGELTQRFVPVGIARLWLSGDGRGLGFAGLIDPVNIDLLEEGHSVAILDGRELLAVHPTSDGGHRDAAAVGCLPARDEARQLILGALIRLEMPLGILDLDFDAAEMTEAVAYGIHLRVAQQRRVLEWIRNETAVRGRVEAPLQSVEIDAELGGQITG